MGKIIIILVVLGIITVGGYYIFRTPESKEKIQQPKQEQEQQSPPQEQISLPKELILSSSSFEHMGNIPVRYTCDGQSINPPLEISGVADNAKSLVLIMEDPDVPKNIRADGTWNHWLKFNLSPLLSKIEEGKDPGGLSGLNTSQKLKYIAPCPPDREHRYFFKLYSLDTMLNLKEGATKSQIEQAMENHILQQTSFIGLYKRQ